MLNAQTFATYSFGFATFLNVVDSEVFRITANACYYFPIMSHRHLHRGIAPMFEGKVTKIIWNEQEKCENLFNNHINVVSLQPQMGNTLKHN